MDWYGRTNARDAEPKAAQIETERAKKKPDAVYLTPDAKSIHVHRDIIEIGLECLMYAELAVLKSKFIGWCDPFGE